MSIQATNSAETRAAKIRGTVQTRTNRPVYVPADDAPDDAPMFEGRGIGKDVHFQTVCTVKSGSERLRKQFEHRALCAGLQFERIGADDGANEHYADMSGLPIRTSSGWMLLPTNLNANVKNEYLVWGNNANLLAFLNANTGEGKAIAGWTFPEVIRPFNAHGSGAATERDLRHRRMKERNRQYDELAKADAANLENLLETIYEMSHS